MKQPSSILVPIALVMLFECSPNSSVAAPLQWQDFPGYRSAKLTPPASGQTGFTLLTPAQTGITFSNQLSYPTSIKNQNTLNGAGLAAGDYDNDGLCDLFFCNLEGESALYRNLGDWKFQEVTAQAGLTTRHQISRGAVFADINGDGHLDLLISSLSGPNACYLNDGQGRFQNITEKAGLLAKAVGGHSLALADVDGDGDLDLYIANYGENSILRSGGTISTRMRNGRPVVGGKYRNRLKIIDGNLVEYGEPDYFYLNDGTGAFTQVSWTGGAFLDEKGAPLSASQYDMSLSVTFRDINQDGYPDIYVCNDFQSPDRIWINDGTGRFRAITEHAIRSTPHFSMGVDFADIDRDGLTDFFVGDMLSRFHQLKMTQIAPTNPPTSHVLEDIDRPQFRRNGMFLNRGDGTYAEIANYAGVEASDWSWSVVFLDVDLDGYEDLLIANGHAYDTQDLDAEQRSDQGRASAPTNIAGKQLRDYPPLRTPNVVFRNLRNRTFQEVGAQWGFNAPQVSHGISLADFDNDGDLDLAVSVLWEPPLIYRNDSTAPRVAVRLRGASPNTHGIGATIKLLGGGVSQSREVISGGRYLAGDGHTHTFAATQGETALSLEVNWRNGGKSVVTNVQPNHLYEIKEPHSPPSERPAAPAAQGGLFKDISSALHHIDAAQLHDEFQHQPLLHKHLSFSGPGITWLDLTGDGFDDLIIGGDTGQGISIYTNNTQGAFPVIWRSQPMAAGQSSIIGWPGSAPTPTLLAGAILRGDGATLPWVSQLVFPGGGKVTVEPGPKFVGSRQPVVGPLATADIDGDGDLDLFVGGRFLEGAYPAPASSRIYINDQEQLRLDTRNLALLNEIGLVSGAVFSDLTGDGFPELLLACEWGPIRVFSNDQGAFSEITAQMGLANTRGWWSGITTGDLDGDGRMDIVASNWGLNSSYHDPATSGVRLYYIDDDDNGTLDLLETTQDPLLGKPVTRRGKVLLVQGIPLLETRFASHKAFSQADPAQVFKTPLAQIPFVSADTFASTVFLNRGNHFEPVPLPPEAQFAPAFGVNVADFNGDGHEDIFLSQNFFAMRSEEPRLDAGRGLLLRGSSTGRFEAVPGQESGITIYGEQRGSATSDLNRDGRIDLAVAQSRGATRLFLNQKARPGLTVRLLGPPGNRAGIGASLRLRFAAAEGSAREIHGGSGYWSQDSYTQVLATPAPPTELAIRWPGGKTTSTPIPPNTTSITIDQNGNATR